MKIAQLNSATPDSSLGEADSNSIHFKLRTFFVVADSFDFPGNSATDVTSMQNLNLLFVNSVILVESYRESLNTFYVIVKLQNFSSLTNTEKDILSSAFLGTKAERESFHTSEEINNNARNLLLIIFSRLDNTETESNNLVILDGQPLEDFLIEANNHAHLGSQIDLDTSNFGGALSTVEDTVQKAIDKLDDSSSGGDMTKAEYDTDNDGIVDNAENLNDGSSGGGNNVSASEIRNHLDSPNTSSLVFYAENLRGTDNSDFAISNDASAVVDSNNNGINVRAFDDTVEEGVSLKLDIPSSATNIKFTFMSRAETAPGGVATVKLNFYEREIPDNATITAWSSATQLTDVSIPTNENFQLDTQTIALATLGLTADKIHQIIISRDSTDIGDDLSGDWNLLFWKVEYT